MLSLIVLTVIIPTILGFYFVFFIFCIFLLFILAFLFFGFFNFGFWILFGFSYSIQWANTERRRIWRYFCFELLPPGENNSAVYFWLGRIFSAKSLSNCKGPSWSVFLLLAWCWWKRLLERVLIRDFSSRIGVNHPCIFNEGWVVMTF